MDPIGKLMQFAAPLVLRMLAKQQQQRKTSPDCLSDMLNEERQKEARSNPDLMGMLSGVLDRNGDGSVVDDVTGMMGKVVNHTSR